MQIKLKDAESKILMYCKKVKMVFVQYLVELTSVSPKSPLSTHNSKRYITDEWLSRLLQRLADKAQIELNRKSLTFHC